VIVGFGAGVTLGASQRRVLVDAEMRVAVSGEGFTGPAKRR